MADSITWDQEAQRYRKNGQFLARSTVRREFERSLANLSKYVDTLGEQLRAGAITATDFRDEMQTIIKQTQMAAAELAKGGRAQMTQSDYGRVGRLVRTQYQFLERFVQDLKSGKTQAVEGRGRQYLRAARSAFLEHDRKNLEKQGYDERRNILHPAEHCAECLFETELGWQPIAQSKEIGTRQCLGNDKCTWQYRNSKTGAILIA